MTELTKEDLIDKGYHVMEIRYYEPKGQIYSFVQYLLPEDTECPDDLSRILENFSFRTIAVLRKLYGVDP